MTFIDQRNQQVADETAFNKLAARIGMLIIHQLVGLGLESLKVPMRIASKMSAWSTTERRWKRSSASRVRQLGDTKFLETCMSLRPAIEPEILTSARLVDAARRRLAVAAALEPAVPFVGAGDERDAAQRGPLSDRETRPDTAPRRFLAFVEAIL